jgi:hypothetical protein
MTSKRRRRRLRGKLKSILARLDALNVFKPAEYIPAAM